MENFKGRQIHVIKNGEKCTMTPNELYGMNESKNQDDVELDLQWYLDNGGVLWEDFKKNHPI